MTSKRSLSLVVLALGIALHAGCASPFSLPRGMSAKPLVPTSVSAANSKPLPAQESAEACLAVALTLAGQNHDVEAIAQFERARQYEPKLRGVSHRLAILYDRTGDVKKASAEFQLALKEDPKNADLLNDVGYFHYNRGRWADAEQHFRAALTLKPDHAKAWTNLGLTLGQQGRFEESLAAFSKVVSEGEAKANLAFVFSTQGKHEEAKAMYRESLASEPDLKIARAALDKLEAPRESKAAPATPAPEIITQAPWPVEAETIPLPPRE